VIFEGKGVAVGIKGTREGGFWRTYRVKAHTAFKGYYWLMNQKERGTFLITCLIDYVQQPCVYDGRSELLYRIEMRENEERYIVLETPELSRGFHDLIVLAFDKPDVHDLSDEFRINTDLNYLYTTRASVLADSNAQDIPRIDYITGQFQPNRISSLNGIVVNREKAPQELHAWTHQPMKPGDILEYYVHLGNDEGPDQSMAVISFLDFKQIPLGKDILVPFASLPAGSRLTIPGHLIAPQEAGIHELIVVLARGPYRLLADPETQELTSEYTWVEPSIRVAIEVVR
jgi:hypothetical protein